MNGHSMTPYSKHCAKIEKREKKKNKDKHTALEMLMTFKKHTFTKLTF